MYQNALVLSTFTIVTFAVSTLATLAPVSVGLAPQVAFAQLDEDEDGSKEEDAVCEDGQVCCNVYDDWPEHGTKSCMPANQCTGIGKDVVPDEFCK